MGSEKKSRIGDMSTYISSLDVSGDDNQFGIFDLNEGSIGTDTNDSEDLLNDTFTSDKDEAVFTEASTSKPKSSMTHSDLCCMVMKMSGVIDVLVQENKTLRSTVEGRFRSIDEKISVISSGIGLNEQMRKNVVEDSKSTARSTTIVLYTVCAIAIKALWAHKMEDVDIPVPLDYLKKVCDATCKFYDTDVRRPLGVLFSTVIATGAETPITMICGIMGSGHSKASIMRSVCLDVMGKLSSTHAFLIPRSLVEFLGRVETINKKGNFVMSESYDVEKLAYAPGELLKSKSTSEITQPRNMTYVKNAQIKTRTDARKVANNIKGGYVQKGGTVNIVSTPGIDIHELLGRANDRIKDVDPSTLPKTPRNKSSTNRSKGRHRPRNLPDNPEDLFN